MHIATTTAQRVRGPTGLALTRSRAIDSLAHRFSRTAPATLIGQILGVAADCGGPLDGPQSRRLHWFQAEVHCLQCGRLVGRVLGPVAVGCPPRWPRHAGPAVFRPAGPNGPARALVATSASAAPCVVAAASWRSSKSPRQVTSSSMMIASSRTSAEDAGRSTSTLGWRNLASASDVTSPRCVESVRVIGMGHHAATATPLGAIAGLAPPARFSSPLVMPTTEFRPASR